MIKSKDENKLMDFSLHAFKCVTYVIIENFTHYLPSKISNDNDATEFNVLVISLFGVLEETSIFFKRSADIKKRELHWS